MKPQDNSNPAPRVSVVIASYNYAHFVPLAIESALAQTMTDLEIIVVDDGSTDNTREAVAHFGAHPQVRLEHIAHVGHPQAKNHGVRLARGEYVAFLDADDIWQPTKLARQLELFAGRPEVGVVYTRRACIDVAGRALVVEETPLYRGRVVEPLVFDNFVCFSSAIVRRSLLGSGGCFDENLNDPIDYDLWLRLALRCQFDYVDEPLVLYRVGHASMSRTNNRWREQVDRVMLRFFGEYGGSEAVAPAVVRRHKYTRWCAMGLAARSHAPRTALANYLRAIACRPWALPAWYGLAALLVPERGRRWYRRLLGRPADWRQPQLARV